MPISQTLALQHYTRDGRRITALHNQVGIVFYFEDYDMSYEHIIDDIKFRRDGLERMAVVTLGSKKRKKFQSAGDILIDGRPKRQNSRFVMERPRPMPITEYEMEALSSYTRRTFYKNIDGTPNTSAGAKPRITKWGEVQSSANSTLLTGQVENDIAVLQEVGRQYGIVGEQSSTSDDWLKKIYDVNVMIQVLISLGLARFAYSAAGPSAAPPAPEPAPEPSAPPAGPGPGGPGGPSNPGPGAPGRPGAEVPGKGQKPYNTDGPQMPPHRPNPPASTVPTPAPTPAEPPKAKPEPEEKKAPPAAAPTPSFKPEGEAAPGSGPLGENPVGKIVAGAVGAAIGGKAGAALAAAKAGAMALGAGLGGLAVLYLVAETLSKTEGTLLKERGVQIDEKQRSSLIAAYSRLQAMKASKDESTVAVETLRNTYKTFASAMNWANKDTIDTMTDEQIWSNIDTLIASPQTMFDDTSKYYSTASGEKIPISKNVESSDYATGLNLLIAFLETQGLSKPISEDSPLYASKQFLDIVTNPSTREVSVDLFINKLGLEDSEQTRTEVNLMFNNPAAFPVFFEFMQANYQELVDAFGNQFCPVDYKTMKEHAAQNPHFKDMCYTLATKKMLDTDNLTVLQNQTSLNATLDQQCSIFSGIANATAEYVAAETCPILLGDTMFNSSNYDTPAESEDTPFSAEKENPEFQPPAPAVNLPTSENPMVLSWSAWAVEKAAQAKAILAPLFDQTVIRVIGGVVDTLEQYVDLGKIADLNDKRITVEDVVKSGEYLAPKFTALKDGAKAIWDSIPEFNVFEKKTPLTVEEVDSLEAFLADTVKIPEFSAFKSSYDTLIEKYGEFRKIPKEDLQKLCLPLYNGLPNDKEECVNVLNFMHTEQRQKLFDNYQAVPVYFDVDYLAMAGTSPHNEPLYLALRQAGGIFDEISNAQVFSTLSPNLVLPKLAIAKSYMVKDAEGRDRQRTEIIGSVSTKIVRTGIDEETVTILIEDRRFIEDFYKAGPDVYYFVVTPKRMMKQTDTATGKRDPKFDVRWVNAKLFKFEDGKYTQRKFDDIAGNIEEDRYFGRKP